jgi:LasA protease
LEFATEVVAGLVVGGVVMSVVKVEVPGRYDVVIAVVDTLWDRLQRGDWPARLPDVGAGSSIFLAPVAWTGGIGVYLRPTPARTPFVGSVPEGATVNIQCTTRGETVLGPFGPTDLWDFVLYNGQAGYVSDGYVNTGTNDPVAPSC